MTSAPKTKIISRTVEFEGWRKLETIVVQHASLRHEGTAFAPITREIYLSGTACIALLYQPDGSSVVYTVTGPLTYTLAAVGVANMQGSQVYVTGLKPGTTVVTVGGEELLGVQDGVGVQT